MPQLKSSDILGEIANEEAAEAKPEEKLTSVEAGAPSETDTELVEKKNRAEQHSAGKPSPYQSELREKLRQKEQFNFGLCPRFVVKEFERLQKTSKMNKREYLYHLLREAGADIPPYNEMDGRKL